MLLSQPEYLSRSEKMRPYEPTKTNLRRLLQLRLATSFLPILMVLIELIMLDGTAPNSWFMLMHLLNVSVVSCLILGFEVSFRSITASYSFWDPAILEENAELEKICLEENEKELHDILPR